MPLMPPPWRRTRRMRRSCSMPKLVRKGNLRRRGTSTSSSRSICKVVLLSVPEARVQGVTKSVAEQVDAQCSHEYKHSRHRYQEGQGEDVRPCLAQHAAPRWDGGGHA